MCGLSLIIFANMFLIRHFWTYDLSILSVQKDVKDMTVTTQKIYLIYEIIAPAAKFDANRLCLQTAGGIFHQPERFCEFMRANFFTGLCRRETDAFLRRLRGVGRRTVGKAK